MAGPEDVGWKTIWELLDGPGRVAEIGAAVGEIKDGLWPVGPPDQVESCPPPSELGPVEFQLTEDVFACGYGAAPDVDM